jgi:hypothetical protein
MLDATTKQQPVKTDNLMLATAICSVCRLVGVTIICSYNLHGVHPVVYHNNKKAVFLLSPQQ